MNEMEIDMPVVQEIDSDAARLELNARHYEYDPTLDAAADLLDQGPAAWRDLHPLLVDQASIYRDFRSAYRQAVAAGVIADDRNAETYEESRSTW